MNSWWATGHSDHTFVACRYMSAHARRKKKTFLYIQQVVCPFMHLLLFLVFYFFFLFYLEGWGQRGNVPERRNSFFSCQTLNLATVNKRVCLGAH